MSTSLKKSFIGQAGIRQAGVISVIGLVMVPNILSAIENSQQQADLIIENGMVYDGSLAPSQRQDIVVRDGKIIFVGDNAAGQFQATKIVNASGKVVMPGFIDPHTHAGEELSDPEKAANLNYLTQGVTTVFIGNDGHGLANIAEQKSLFDSHGIGTNVGIYVGHGGVRRTVMGVENRAPNDAEMAEMKTLVSTAMSDGAIGLSTGLFYVPGAFATTDEVIELATIAGRMGGVYDTHLRDESTYSIGVLGAIEETLDIGLKANIPVNFSHIKALGVDVWGYSTQIIDRVNKARAAGQAVTADQYPWRASGTSVTAALMPKWSLAGGFEAMVARMDDPEQMSKIREEMTDNLRRRGGAEAVLITGRIDNEIAQSIIGKNLKEIAADWGVSDIDAAIKIVRAGGAGVASFNMNPEDIRNLMKQPWVMTSSDGSTGHPRKFASYPRKYEVYVRDERLLTMAEFVHKSSGMVADTFNLCDRGYLKEGYSADLSVVDLENYRAKADFQNPENLSTGVETLVVNGTVVIDKGTYTGARAGQSLDRGKCE